jgi:DNA-binding transcriptional MerR regulator
MNVGEVAALAGVTVRTLHHYDRIGLLSPSERTAAVYRELGFPLEEIATLLDDPDADPVVHLRRQLALLRDRLERTQAMVAAVEKEMEARSMGISLTPEERFEVFGEDDPSKYDTEAEERWGQTDAYKESRRRTSSYTKDDWLRIKEEGADVERRFAEALRSGAAPDSAQAMDVAEEHRQHISRWFYDCPPEMHAGLGRMYVEDERFTAHYEEIAPGLAQYVSTAVQANAARQG